MNRTSTIALTLSVLLLAACSRGDDAGDSVETSGALWGQNLTLNATGLPKAEVSAKGDFIIDGKQVPVTDAQRALVVAYHRELGGIADAGIATGKEGAKLAGKAVGAAVKGIFSGNPDQIEPQIEAEAKKVEAEALKICDRLPGLYKAQQDLAAALPEFKPYATMDQSDVDDCGTHDADATANATQRAKVQTEIRQDIRDGIRTTIRDSLRQPSSPDTAAKGDAAAEADAAAEVQATSSAAADKAR